MTRDKRTTTGPRAERHKEMLRHLAEPWEPVHGAKRPRNRSECRGGPRPCPWASCRYHLALDVTSAGSILHAFPGVELEDMPDTCALDVADRGAHSLDDVGARMNVTHERVRQIEDQVAEKIRDRMAEFRHG